MTDSQKIYRRIIMTLAFDTGSERPKGRNIK